MKYDFLIVGAGPVGCTFARLATDGGYSCLVVDKRDHIAGNAYDYERVGIRIHKYGAHIFRTNNVATWQFVNRFAKFSSYRHYVVGQNGSMRFPMPINLQTMATIWEINGATPRELISRLQLVKKPMDSTENVEDWCLANIGERLYEATVKHYTEKQWGKSCRDLPAAIIRRLPIRLSYEPSYFGERYQGLPVDGYTALFAAMLDGIDVALKTDALDNKLSRHANHMVYTGPIDRLYAYRLGHLEYRSLRFETDHADCNVQCCPVVNHTDKMPYTRSHEWKFMHPDNRSADSLVTYEYPQDWTPELEPYYPVTTSENLNLASRYLQMARSDAKLTVVGRLALYKYISMDQAIGQAITTYRKLIGKSHDSAANAFDQPAQQR